MSFGSDVGVGDFMGLGNLLGIGANGAGGAVGQRTKVKIGNKWYWQYANGKLVPVSRRRRVIVISEKAWNFFRAATRPARRYRAGPFPRRYHRRRHW